MLKVKIDPGHVEGYNKGVCSGYYEGTKMFKLSMFELEEFSKYAGVEASLTRGLTNNPSLAERAASAVGYDLLISNHTNATKDAVTTASDVVIYESVKRSRSPLTTKLGIVIANTMGTEYKIKQRLNTFGTDYYGILRNSIQNNVKLPLLLEHGFHTNLDQCAWLNNDNNLLLLAKNVVSCIAEHYGLILKVPAAPKPQPVERPKLTQLDGLLRIIYKGADGVNARTSPDFGDNVKTVVTYGEVFTVTGETPSFYRIKSGLFIAKNPDLVEFIKKEYKRVSIDTKVLNIRSGPGTKFPIVGTVREYEVYTIVDEKNGWGKLKSGVGWIALQYTKEL